MPRAAEESPVDPVYEDALVRIITAIVAALMHNAGSLIVIFNSARLVRHGEELEPFQPAPVNPPGAMGGGERRIDPAPQLAPRMA